MPAGRLILRLVRGTETPDHRESEESAHGDSFGVILPAGVVDRGRHLYLPVHAVGELDPQVEDLVSPARHRTVADPVALMTHFADFLRDGDLFAVFRRRVRQQAVAAHEEEIEDGSDSEQVAQPVHPQVVEARQPAPQPGEEGHRDHGSAGGCGDGQPPDDPGFLVADITVNSCHQQERRCGKTQDIRQSVAHEDGLKMKIPQTSICRIPWRRGRDSNSWYGLPRTSV